jgi:polyhydroxybutyrate depolymerase
MLLVAGCRAGEDVVAAETEAAPSTTEEDGSSSGDPPSTSGDPTTPETSTTTGSSSGEPQPGSESSTGDDTTDIPPTSPGCGTPATTDWYAPYTVFWGEETLLAEVEADGLTRQYIIELPENYSPDTAYPVVFTFHGLGATMDNAFGQHIGQLWEHQVVAVYPQGVDNAWNLAVGSADSAFFTAMLNQIGTALCLDMERIFVQGTSMGGGMSNFLACAHGDLIAASGPAASWFPIAPEECAGAVPQFLVHGTNDPTVSFESGVQARDTWLTVNGCSTTSTPYDPSPCVIYDDCESGAPVVWCAHDGGHDQPGVHGLDDDMMSFFAQR